MAIGQEWLCFFDNTILNFATALQLVRLSGEHSGAEFRGAINVKGLSIDWEPSKTSRRERLTVRDKFESFGLERNDAIE